jgi:hypothetical protein
MYEITDKFYIRDIFAFCKDVLLPEVAEITALVRRLSAEG